MFHSLKPRNEKVNGNHLKRTKNLFVFLITLNYLFEKTKNISK
ncbi:hypothetical protein RV13_GL002766 [Enterococcus raffinosus]|nr:hypothetical protein RV13_GL002766 [Enterococcus raffinosus]